MAIFDFIDPLVFLIALAVGIFFTYIIKEPPRVVFRHPTPQNIETTVFRNQNGTCYKYKIEGLPCPSQTHEIPISTPRVPMG
jgi:hypothetical protein